MTVNLLFIIEESSLNKINAELFLKFKSTKYFCAKLSLTNKSILEFIISITLKYWRNVSLSEKKSSKFFSSTLRLSNLLSSLKVISASKIFIEVSKIFSEKVKSKLINVLGR